MQRVLLLGGNGLFGIRIGRLFALQKIPVEVLVGCRSKGKADDTAKMFSEFRCDSDPGRHTKSDTQARFIPFVTGDLPPANVSKDVREETLSSLLKKSKATMVINTVGPFTFQRSEQDYFPPSFSLAAQCAAHGIHYVDLADEREYLNRFVELMDPIAHRNKVCLVTGASTTPGITMQVTKLLTKPSPHLYTAEPLSNVTSVTWALSPGNKIGDHGSGSATVASIINSLGKPIAEPEGAEATEASLPTVWSEIQAYPFRWLSSVRYVARMNQADIDLVNKEFAPPSNQSHIPVTCLAGIELRSLTWGLGVVSHILKWLPFLRGPVSSLAVKATDFTRKIGTSKGGFSVQVEGSASTGKLQRRWDLLAENGDGPYIPAIPAVVVAKNILRQRHSSGAFICGTEEATSLFSFEDFDAVIRTNRLSLYWSIFDNQSNGSPYLYHRVMGSAFYRMPSLIQEMHQNSEDIVAEGKCHVIRGKSLVAKCLGTFLGLAKEGKTVETVVNLVTIRNPRQEIWIRNFEGNQFHTVQRQCDSFKEFGLLQERVGITKRNLRRYFVASTGNWTDFMTTDATAIIKGYPFGLSWDVINYKTLGGIFSLPKLFHAHTTAEERVIVNENGETMFQFNVKIKLPLRFGLLVHYCGTLRIRNRARNPKLNK